jgi:phospholipase A1
MTVLALAGLITAHPVLAAEAQFIACRNIPDDTARLACYDSAAASQPLPSPVDQHERPELGSVSQEQAAQVERRRRLGASLTDRWELDDSNRRGTFLLRPYKPMYLLLANRTDHTNDNPSSPSPDHTLSDPAALKKIEAKFQISLKAKVWENVFPNNGDLWLGYTQSSRWQVYNSKDSAPFRETNYEPEAMLVFRTNYDLFGLKGRMIGLGINHQSNGRPLPLSRSWNRVTADFGFERDDWMVIVRPWWRIKETADKDDNPGIENYMGRGELLVARKYEGHVFSLLGRHTLRRGENSRGSLQFDWGIPVSSYLKAHLQLFTGYGESMIDYNHRQTTVGLGVSLVDWF